MKGGARRGLLAAALLVLAGCRDGGAVVAPDLDARQGARLILIDYVIAHGMAESYLMSGRATPSNLVELVRYDHAALLAISGSQADPSRNSLVQSAAAVRALLDYTTRMDISAGSARTSRYSRARNAP